MKQSTLSQMMLSALCVITLGMTACGQKDAGGSSAIRIAPRGGDITPMSPSVGGGGGGAIGGGTVPSAGATCQNNITGTANLAHDEMGVMGLLSATIDPKNFGRICRVNLSANLKFDATGNLVPGSQMILIQVVDEYVGQVWQNKVIPLYEIQFKSATQGFFDKASGAFQVVFSDQYGTFWISGQVEGINTRGSVYFQNNSNIAGGAGAKGILGNFTIPTAALLN